MAKVKLTKVYAGPAGCYPERSVIDVSDQEALDLCAAGAAVPVKEAEVETALAPEADETAVAKGGKGAKAPKGGKGAVSSATSGTSSED